MLNDRCQVPSEFSYPEYVASISQNGGAINYVKFLIDYPSFATLPANGDSSKIYVTNDNNKLYRWVDTAFIEISPTSSTTWGNIGGTLTSQTDLQNALNAKAPLASPTFTGTVSGITKAMVGLGNLDNTTDLLKPISTATQNALNLKYDASNPSNYLTAITSGQILAALGFTPYNATNPSGYTTNVGTVTSVGALTLGTTGTDVSSTVANGTTTPVITLNIPTASATNRGVLSAADWATFYNKQNTISLTTTGTSGSATLVGTTLNIPNYAPDLSSYVTLATAQTITGVKTFTGGSLYINSGNISTAGTLYLGDGTITKAPGSGFTLSSLNITGNATFNSFLDMVAGSAATPQIKGSGGGTGIYWPNGASGTSIGFAYSSARMFESIGIASGVNYLRVTQAITGSSPSLSAQGTDVNINLTLTPKGSGSLIISSTTKIGAETTPNASSVLDIESTTKGILFPRMTTTQKNAISSPATGLVVYDTTLNKLCVRTESAWETLTSL
jgi:hypothetical protein